MSERRKIPVSDRRARDRTPPSGLQTVSESPSEGVPPSHQKEAGASNSAGTAHAGAGNDGPAGRAPSGARDDASHSGLQTVLESPSGNASPSQPGDAPDYLDDLRRLQADFENYRKRMMREQSRLAERASLRLIERLLPVLDDLERAVEHGAGGGVDLVLRSFKDVLASEGLEEIPAEGQQFDPRVHEAFAALEDPSVQVPTCRTVMRTGYRLGDNVIRPAMVSVARPPEQPAAGAEDPSGPDVSSDDDSATSAESTHAASGEDSGEKAARG